MALLSDLRVPVLRPGGKSAGFRLLRNGIVSTCSRRLWVCCILLAPTAAVAADVPAMFRPPAVPLVVHDPYFSVWSPADRLADATTTHWTGKPHPLRGLVRLDGAVFRVLGAEPAEIPALPQTGLRVLPTRTVTEFSNKQIRLTITFLTPALPGDLDILARPVTYLAWEARSADGKPHEVSAYFEASALLAVDTPDQAVTWGRVKVPGLEVARVGSKDQPVLGRQGDDLRIDWGWLYLATPSEHGRVAIADGARSRQAFLRDQTTPGTAVDAPVAAENAPALVARLYFGRVERESVERHLMLAYDDLWSIRYFEEDLRPYWRRQGGDAARLLADAERDFAALGRRCDEFDRELMADLTRVGGADYARLAALAYRQTLAGCKLAADRQGQPLLFPKENHSNGCIATVDVIYPMAPFTLALSPALTKAMLVPVLDYAASWRWKFAYAPHDLGRYPHATGQVYGGGESTDDRQMMVEESANMLLLVAALAEAEEDTGFARRYRPLLEKWAAYLVEKGLDPENQLCTDDFAGHLAHNVNLSAKAIVALGSFGRLCQRLGAEETAREYRRIAGDFAVQWLAKADDGDHFRLAFDKPGSWSQKYNIVWDRVLGLGLFPKPAVAKEVAFYRRTQREFGLPLDSRSTYTKLDWTVWTAAISGRRDDFDALLAPLVRWVSATPDRSPLTDWYFADTAKKRGFTARPVVGGVFLPLLGDRATWRKWVERGSNTKGPWAPAPILRWTEVSPTATAGPVVWQARFESPGDPHLWMKPDVLTPDDQGWSEQPAPFGQSGEAGLETRSRWPGGDLWIRRDFRLPDPTLQTPRIRATCSGPTEVYLNGILACRLPGGVRGYENLTVSEGALATLTPGRNVLAVHSRAPRAPNAQARVHVDAGLIDLKP